MKEIIARSSIVIIGFLVSYLLMAFIVTSFNITQWTVDQRGKVAIIQWIVVFMVCTYPGKLTK